MKEIFQKCGRKLLLEKKIILRNLLYVQHVDEEKDMVSETPDRYVEQYLLVDRTIFPDSNFTEYLRESQPFKINGERKDCGYQSLLQPSSNPTRVECYDSRLCRFQNGEHLEWF